MFYTAKYGFLDIVDADDVLTKEEQIYLLFNAKRKCERVIKSKHKITEMVQEWFEEHNNEFEVFTWPPNSPEHLWDVLNKQFRSMEAPPHNL
ncbi:hypothetical protein DPX16_5339 [Anabarilius grahami]|uniref:Uncharacterized protein n=1 Tax=Anabarilius grahami TaxID=495550 RepID=A0A3N0YD46_ANAGA|nr:hypothetical protein DPX16_5339 [Anabarilius grahami]